VFTGHTLAALESREGGAALLAVVDTVIDGRFEAGRRDTERPLHRLEQPAADPPQRALRRPGAVARAGGVELQWAADGRLSVHGEPGLARRLALALAGSGVRGAPEPVRSAQFSR
jgi:hypothetical protein